MHSEIASRRGNLDSKIIYRGVGPWQTEKRFPADNYNIEENLIVITNGSSSIALYHVYYDPVLAASQYLFLKSGTICRLIKTIQ